ncbi:ATP-grasp domain-containing protein [Streptomonospora nanhaiensis]|uniref:ATP-grasp domain-containing protein n=1 Tax=Streptomonospora nanhaiensis TaxID=1323731 RepID=UPI001C393791|nr:ATP-grasp domain-containing protein [Streptomonospora nanhaiensis]MBV2366834.1 ATP-grasp domain-containing protein [Streptomonospora nanhaiensis]
MTKNIFVLGLDEMNRQTLSSIPGSEDYRFHPLLTKERLHGSADLDLGEVVEEARARLDAFDGSVDAIIGYWDFPVSTLVPVLCAERGLPSAPLEAVVKCEHKYWSRLEQAEVIDEIPGFAEIPFDSERPPEHLSYPMWLKPVKSFSSELAFRVTDDAEFREALAQIEEGAGRVGEPFEWVLERVEMPEAVAKAGGAACLAEEECSGRQLTVEGFVYAGRPHVYGVVDSHNYPDTPSFLRYQYPSDLPGPVIQQVTEVSEKVVTRLGLDNCTFNIEYFHDPDTGRTCLLEVNPRHSQSHARLLEFVDGYPNHAYVVELALGREPHLREGGGQHNVGAKWFLRRFSDGVVRTAPDADDVARMSEDIPGTAANILVEPGTRLSDLTDQDSYSFCLAEIFTGANDTEGLKNTYELCLARLPFEIEDVEDAGDTEPAGGGRAGGGQPDGDDR